MAAKTKTVPEVESEISPGVAHAVDDMARVVRDGGLESLSLQVGGTEPLVIDRETAERIGRNVAALQRRSVDTETGEVFQPTLSDELFPATRRRQVPMVKLAVSGSVEMTLADFQRYCSEGLQPGRKVTMTVSGYLPDPHSKWVKRKESVEGLDGKRETFTSWELEGQVKVKALELEEFELGEGFYHGD